MSAKPPNPPITLPTGKGLFYTERRKVLGFNISPAERRKGLGFNKSPEMVIEWKALPAETKASYETRAAKRREDIARERDEKAAARAEIAAATERKAAESRASRDVAQYIVVSGNIAPDFDKGISNLETNVNARLRQGWKLKGGVSVGGSRGYQALTRDFVPQNLLDREESLRVMPSATAATAEASEFPPSGTSIGGGGTRTSEVTTSTGGGAASGGAGGKANERKRSRKQNRKRSGTRRRKN